MKAALEKLPQDKYVFTNCNEKEAEVGDSYAQRKHSRSFLTVESLMALLVSSLSQNTHWRGIPAWVKPGSLTVIVVRTLCFRLFSFIRFSKEHPRQCYVDS